MVVIANDKDNDTPLIHDKFVSFKYIYGPIDWLKLYLKSPRG